MNAPVSAPLSSGLYLGLLSGTSADGIDAALVDFSSRQPRILHALSQPFEKKIRQQVLALMRPDTTAALDWIKLNALDQKLARAFANAALQCLQEARIKPAEITAIGCHGQTVFHQPHAPYAGSWQIGSPFALAQLTGIPVISQFRQMDMALGGQGAPLAPLLHRELFARPDRHVAVVNLGGIANVTWLGADGSFCGFDTGPANCLMDEWVYRHRGKKYDDGGRWAGTGRVATALLSRLMADAYFGRPAPKSTGREHFNSVWLDAHLNELDDKPAPADVQATLLELTARSVAAAIDEWRSKSLPAPLDVVVCGGGAHNQVLLDRISGTLGEAVISSAQRGIDPDYLEAVLFAWLAYQRWQGVRLDLCAITGSSRPHLAGVIVRP
jgi:anhydro-N-acetylmuramic acid kinase